MDEEDKTNIQGGSPAQAGRAGGEDLVSEAVDKSSVGERSAKGKEWYREYGARAEKEEPLVTAPKFRYRGQLFAFGLLFLVLVTAYALAFLFIQSKGERIRAVATELERNAAKEKEFGELRDIVGRSGGKIEALDSYFIGSSEIVALIQNIEDFAEAAGVALSFNSVSPKKDGAKEYLDMSFETGGGFSDTMYFLTLLENLPLKLSFERVFIEKQDGDKGRRAKLPGAWGGSFLVFVESFTDEKK